MMSYGTVSSRKNDEIQKAKKKFNQYRRLACNALVFFIFYNLFKRLLGSDVSKMAE